MNHAATAVTLLLRADISGAESAIRQLDRSFSGTLSRINAQGQSLINKGKKMQEAGLSNMAGGAAMLAPLGLAVKQAIELESKIADVAKVTNDDFGSKGFTELTNNAIAVSNLYGGAATSVAELMAELAAGGVAKKEIDGVARSASKISFAFDMAAGEAAKGYMVIKNAMGITLKETDAVMDAMNAATNKFGGKASNLVTFMAKGGASVASTLKVSGTHMQAFGNALQVVGQSGEESATIMKRFQKAIIGNKELSAMFVKAGGGAKGLIAILEKAKASGNAFSWLNKRDVGEYSNAVAQLAANMDTATGVRNQLNFLSKNSNVTGSVQNEAQNRLKTTGAQLEILKQQTINAGIKIGGALLPSLMKLAQAAKPLIDNLSKWITENPKLVEGIVKIIAAIAALKIGVGALQFGLGSTITTIGKFITGGSKALSAISKFSSTIGPHIGKTFTVVGRVFTSIGPAAIKAAMGLGKAFRVIGIAFSTVSKLLIANPWILALTAIAAAAYLIYKNWDKISTWFSKLWTKVAAVFRSYIKLISALLIKFTPAGLIYKHWDKIKGWFSSLWGTLKELFNKGLEGIQFLFLNFTPQGLIYKHWSPITAFFQKLWDKVKEIFAKAIGWIKNSAIGQLISKILSGLQGAVSSTRSALDYASKNSLDATINHVGGTKALPQPKSYARNLNSSMSFAPVINISGSMDQITQQKLTAQMRRDFEKQMADYSHGQKRKGFA
ncbi:TP901 family phage tail tape measure protein [Chryseobacterium sp. 7]|uniref:phage tail tape measure protein n=1 Tax=Chryseobacterium sp. 7 TaxID=2035214 RepID=UPI000EB1EA6B|nr:phage tail tape measure protein [Chryseobacterium sp. 7]RLJ31379.1 TP901 family phage tail tape measure protein [Chryseobacterium sp. 7]